MGIVDAPGFGAAVVAAWLSIGCGARSDLALATDSDSDAVDEGAPLYPCPFGFADCDGEPENGCEIEVRSDSGHCSSCGSPCPSGMLCAGGSCWEPAAVSQIAVGSWHTCALRASGAVLCWGRNDVGQLGRGYTSPFETTPAPVVALADAVEVDADLWNTCARRRDGRIVCWGSGASLVLGNGDMADSNVPTLAHDVAGAAGIAVGPESVLVLVQDGSVFGWGANRLHQLGVGSGGDRNVPARIQDLDSAVHVTAGSSLCAVINSGRLACWGRNRGGQVGNGEWGHVVPYPTDVEGLAPVLGAETKWQTCTVALDRSVYCWGCISCGDRLVEVALAPGISDAAEACSGHVHGCARLRDGRIACWGANTYPGSGELGGAGMLGGGRNAPSYTRDAPVFVDGIENAVDLGTGDVHSCVLRLGGDVACWGDNKFGQLGDGTTNTAWSPVAVVGLQ